MYRDKLFMKKHNTNAGAALLSLLRQQRYLYHQLKILADRQQELAGANSPELLLEVISGRRKLVEKLREVDSKLRLVKTNWQKLSEQIGPDYKDQAHKIANEVQEIIGEIMAVTPSETTQNLPLYQDREFDELFAKTDPGYPFREESKNGVPLNRKD